MRDDQAPTERPPTKRPDAPDAVGTSCPDASAFRVFPGHFFLGFRPSKSPPTLPCATFLIIGFRGKGRGEKEASGLWVHPESHFRLVGLGNLAESTSRSRFLWEPNPHPQQHQTNKQSSDLKSYYSFIGTDLFRFL